jgi:restriction system protein
MIPDYQSLMRPVLKHAAKGETRIGELIGVLANEIGLSEDEQSELLPSGANTVFANRVHWAKTYLKQAGLIAATKRAHFVITERGSRALIDQPDRIDNRYLRQFDEFNRFQNRENGNATNAGELEEAEVTPDEKLREAYESINESLSSDLIAKVREMPPAFFEALIVQLLVSMGYGGTSADAGRALGRAGDDGVDGVIDQDPLGVDQIYIQAKRYAEGNTVGSGAIRDFFGGLSLKRATKGIFVTTSQFTSSAKETAQNLGSRIVLIDGAQLTKLMIRYNIGCRTVEQYHVKRMDKTISHRSSM